MGWPHRRAKICDSKEAAKFNKQKSGAMSGRGGHTARRSFFFDFLAFSLLTLIFPLRRHKASGDGSSAGAQPPLYWEKDDTVRQAANHGASVRQASDSSVRRK